MTYDALLLDHDGVVVTLGEETALRQSARAALRDAGVTDPDPEAVEAMTIRVSMSELESVSSRYGLDPDRLWRHRDDRVAEALRAETTAGRKEPYDDVDVLRDLPVSTGVVSNNQTRIVDFVLEYYDLADRFETVRARDPTRESLVRKKPRPTYLEAAMADLGVEHPLYVGDSESDVEAGRRAGLDVAFLRRSHNRDASLTTTPEYEVSGLDDVVDIL